MDYKRKKLSNKIKTKLAFHAARKFLNKILDEKIMIVSDIIGKENLRDLDGGAIITCNHFNALDSFAVQLVYEESISKKVRRKKKFYRVIREGNYTSFPGFYGMLMKHCYTLPLASNAKVMSEFLRATKEILEDGNLVLVYPEQSMWWNYRKPKPLQPGAFKIATMANVPVVPVFICMKDSDIVDGDGFKVQEYEIHILKPIYPDNSLGRKEKISKMMDENYDVWKDVYESYYKKELTYNS